MSNLDQLLQQLPEDKQAEFKRVVDSTGEKLANALSMLGVLAATSMDRKGIEHRAINAALVTAYGDAFARALVRGMEDGKAVSTFNDLIPAFRQMIERYSADFNFAQQANVAEQGNA